MSTESMSCIATLSKHTAMREGSLANLWQNHSRHLLASYLTLSDTSYPTTFPFSRPENRSPTAPNLWTQSTMISVQQLTPARLVIVTHHLHPPRTAPIAHDSTQLAEQTALHGIPAAPNVTRLDTGDQNAMVASQPNQRMHLPQIMQSQLGHNMGSPDAHLGAIGAALAEVVSQMP